MLALAFFQWWYGLGWLRLLRGVGRSCTRIIRTFSMPILLRTLFAPWRRIISYGNDSFIEGLKAILDNTISRIVGFGVRLIVLLTATIGLALTAIVGSVVLVVWPFLPPLALVLIGRGLVL